MEQTEKHVKEICKPGTTECCRYLTMGPTGWGCEKHSSLKGLLDKRVEEKTIRAVGDNCEGVLPSRDN